MNPIAPGKFLVFPGFRTLIAFFGADVIEAVVEVLVGIGGVLLQEIVEIAPRIVVGRWEIPREKTLMVRGSESVDTTRLLAWEIE